MKGLEVEHFSLPIRVVFYEEDGDIVAHCLEFDLVGCGDSPEEAFEVLSTAIALQVDATFKSGNVENLFSPAPGKYLRMFAAGKSKDLLAKGVGKLSIAIEVEQVEISDVITREYFDSESLSGDLALA